MKLFFFILLLINLGLFLLIYPQQQVEENAPTIADMGELKLAREQNQTTNKINEGDIVDLKEFSQDSQDSLPAQPEEKQSQPSTSPAVQTESVNTRVQVTEALIESEPPSNRALPDSATLTSRCAMVGYVNTRSAAEQISVRLRALGFKPVLQAETRKEQAGYWVLIPQQANRRDAVRIAKKLEKAGVSDLWRFTSGDLVHAISLGLFRDKFRAAVRKREIDALGFKSVIQPRYRETTDYWLSYQVNGSPSIGDKEWSGLVNDFPELVNKEVECQ
jgi:hypothetical protein